VVSRRERERAVSDARRAVLLLNLLGVCVGTAAVVASVLLREGLVEKLLEVAGGALIAAGIVSFVFGSLTIRETTLQVDHAVSRTTEDVLEPIR
jgi:uncharacterized membrane protein YccC